MTIDDIGDELKAARPTPNGQFYNEGYRLFPLPVDLSGFFDPRLKVQFDIYDHPKDYTHIHLADDLVALLNGEHDYFRAPMRRDRKRLQRYLWSIADDLEAEIGLPFRVVNVRAWATHQGKTNGPLAWHVDGDSPYVRKVMLYPQAMNPQNGTIEITKRDGKTLLVETDAPAAILYESAILRHRGVAPSVAERRPIIEVTIIPARRTDIVYRYAGQNARVPEHV